MHTLMNEGKNYFIHIYGERMFYDVFKDYTEQTLEGLYKELHECYKLENYRGLRVFIAISGYTQSDQDMVERICDLVKTFYKNQSGVYLCGDCETMGQQLYLQLAKEGCQGEFNGHVQGKNMNWDMHGKKWVLLYQAQNEALKPITMEEAHIRTHAIRMDNLRVLVEDGPKGKSIHVGRIIKDKEYYIYYYIFYVAEKMVQMGLVSRFKEFNDDIALVPLNEYGHELAIELSKFLGTYVITEDEILSKDKKVKKFILVRDVVHMFAELTRMTKLLESMGAVKQGSACIIEIDTGVGSMYNQAFFYRLNLKQGITKLWQEREKFRYIDE